MKKKKKASALDTASTHICILHKNKNGIGSIAIDKKTDIIITIPDNQENFALNDDEVEVLAWQDHNGSFIGKVTQITAHNTTNLVGLIQAQQDKGYFLVNNPKFGDHVVALDAVPQDFSPTELFNAIITNYPSQDQPFFTVRIANAIGQLGDDQAFIAQLLIEANVPTEFSKDALAQAHKYGDTLSPNEITDQRTDLRALNFVTIDGEDAKDFDDAVFCSYENNIYTLYVVIADVSHYVTPNSPLDEEAYSRGTSVYLPRQVIPMLPEKLSNNLCSLNPYVDRLVVCSEMQIDRDGNILDYKIYNGIINSKARLTYNQVQTWLNDLSAAPQHIVTLNSVFRALLKSRDARGAIDFDSTEPCFVFNQDGVVSDIIPKSRLDAHKLIEECMLAANVSVANFLIKHGHPGLFRVHEKPSEDKFNNLKAYLNSLGIEFDVAYQNLIPMDYAVLLAKVHKHEQFAAIQQTVLRSMQLAIYSPTNIGHFGLSYENYLHFTSPIRRYPDLLTHRAIKKILLDKTYEYPYNIGTMGEHTSFTERRAEDLERKVHAFYKCQYAKSHIGSTFDGTTTALVNFGLFVYIPDLLLDGLVHITELGKDYFVYDEKKQVLRGKRTGIEYHAGQVLKVKITGVDIANLFIDFALDSDNNI